MKNRSLNIVEKGYRPIGEVDISRPPQGGSGMPPKEPAKSTAPQQASPIAKDNLSNL